MRRRIAFLSLFVLGLNTGLLVAPEGFACDTWVALRDAAAQRRVLFAKNSDRTIFDSQPLVLHPRKSWPAGAMIDLGRISVPQAGETFATLGSGPYWCWGYEEGINEFGVVIGNEGVSTKPLQEAIAAARESRGPKPGPTGMDLVRLGLERSRTAKEAVETIAALTETYGQFGSGLPGQRLEGAYDNSYLVADPREAWILETAGIRWAAKRIEGGTASISNTLSLGGSLDLSSADLAAHAREKGWWTGSSEAAFSFEQAYSAEGRDQEIARERAQVRANCSLGLLREKSGSIDESWMKRIARDRSTDPSLDLDATASSCVASLPADGGGLPVFWWCASVPSSGIFVPFFVHGTELPAFLSAAGTAGKRVVPPETAPTDRYSPDSYWWVFRDLTDLVNLDRPGRLAAVRKEFDALEQSFAAALPPVLKSATELRKAGKTVEAARVLDDFSAACVERAAAAARALRDSWKPAGSDKSAAPEEAGVYIANFGAFADAEWNVSARDGRLFLEIPGQGALELRPPDAEGFRALAASPQAGVSFSRRPEFGVTAMIFRRGAMSFELPRKGIVLPPEIPLEELRKFLGEYHGDELDETLEIVIKNNSLALKISGQKTYELRPPDAEGKRFFRVAPLVYLVFKESETGGVESFTYHQGPSSLTYEKIK